jgi:hypothetical protein
MFAKPIASGLMLTAIAVLGGGALLQQDSAGDARTAVVTDVPEAEAVTEPAPERAASAPGRVVDSAGFPAVPEGEREVAAAKPGPMVTVNGRPVNGERQPVAAQPAPEAVAEAEAVDESA